MSDSSWLDERFRALDQRILGVEDTVRTKADGPAVIRELEQLRSEIKDLEHESAEAVARAERLARSVERDANKTANDLIRSGRTENLKLIGIIVGAFSGLGGAIIAAIATGKVG